MSAPCLIPEADMSEAEAFTRARKSWISAECAELQRHRTQQLGCTDRIITSDCEVSVDPVGGHLADTRLGLLQGQNHSCESCVEGLNPGEQVVMINHVGSLSVVRQRLRWLIDSGKAKIAEILGGTI